MHNTINFWYGNWEKAHDEEKMPEKVFQLCTLTKTSSGTGFLSVNGAIPKKSWELSTYFFEKTTEISRFVISPSEILLKTKLFIPKIFCKII